MNYSDFRKWTETNSRVWDEIRNDFLKSTIRPLIAKKHKLKIEFVNQLFCNFNLRA